MLYAVKLQYNTICWLGSLAFCAIFMKMVKCHGAGCPPPPPFPPVHHRLLVSYATVYSMSKDSALSGIENVQLEVIHSSKTIRNSPNSLKKQQSHSYGHYTRAVPLISPLLGLVS